jgi:DNA polymerase III subunit epsilon
MFFLLAASFAIVLICWVLASRNTESNKITPPVAIEARRATKDQAQSFSVQDQTLPIDARYQTQSLKAHIRPLDGPPYVETLEDRVRRKALNEERRATTGKASQTKPLPGRRKQKKSVILPEIFVVLDLETTGLDAYRNEIIEIGAIRLSSEVEVLGSFQSLVKPSKPLPRNITSLIGISQEMVDRDGATLEIALAQFLTFIGDLPLVAFNAQFDMAFLASAAKRCGITINNNYSCALQAARRAWPGRQSYKLSDLAKAADLPLDDTHRSLGDCKRTAIIYAAAISKIGSA